MNELELPAERLATTDEEGRRVFLHPLESFGFFKKIRNIVHFALLIVFLVLPWTTMNGVQTLLLDLPHRRFTIFGTTFWAHDAPIIFFVLAGMAFALALSTAIFGRAWCGWACPQTVFIESVFRRIEAWIEGDSHARRALNRAGMCVSKFLKRLTKWICFAIIALMIANSFLAYFVGSEVMFSMIQDSPKHHLTEFFITMFVAGILLFNFGWFREQFCVIMCPYGRLQSILMDETSLVIMYDKKRGEPRRSTPGIEAFGDCINCYRCVAVCPTGIDIRRGSQLECVACAACIDACDDIMTKVKKPTGLIRYDRESASKKRISPKALFHSALLSLVIFGFIVSLSKRSDFSFAVLRARGLPYEKLSDGLTNHFRLEANNHSNAPIKLFLEVPGSQVITAQNPMSIDAGETNRLDFFVKFDSSLLANGRGNAHLVMDVKSTTDTNKTHHFTEELPLVGPNH